MSYIIETQQNLIKDIMHRIGVCKTKQLVNCLVKNDNKITYEDAMNILNSLQRNRYLLLSQDGWAMTVGAYMQLADDKFFDKTITAATEFAIPYDIGLKLEIDKNIVDCMWVVADNMPDSKEFILSNYPFGICFDKMPDENQNGSIYQIVKIPNGMERTKVEIIKNLPKIESESLRESIKRIAIIEDEHSAWMMPHLGITEIYKINESKQSGLELIEKREGKDIWSDYVD